jgi:hypothetical protein
MGGLPGGGIDRTEHDFALWEKRIDALMNIAFIRGHFTVDAMRRALEDMGEQAFEDMSYYERWVAVLNHNLIEAGVYSTEEIAARLAEVEARGPTYGEASLGDG